MTDAQNNESHSQVIGVAFGEKADVHICNKSKDTVALGSYSIQLQGILLRAVKAQTRYLKEN